MSIARRRPSTIWALFGLCEPELGPPRDYLDLMIDISTQCLRKVDESRYPIGNRQHVYAETRLQRCLLVEIVQNDIGVGVALERDHQARLSARRVVLEAADPGEIPGITEVGNSLGNSIDRGLVGISVTTISDAPLFVSLISATARIRTEPRPVR